MKITKSDLLPNSFYTYKAKLIGVVVFLFFCVFFSLLIFQQYHISKKAKIDAMQAIINGIHESLEQSLKDNYADALMLALTINDKGIPENFEAVGKHILETDHSIDAVQLVPNGVIGYTYPLKGNENSIGINILKDKKYKFETLKTIESRKMYFAGPFELRQGGIGILGRLAIYKNNRFWGFSAIIIRLNTLLNKQEIKKVDTSKYSFQLSKMDPLTKREVFFLESKKQFDPENAVKAIIKDGDWHLYLIDKRPNELTFPFVLRGISALLLAFLIAFLTVSFFKKPAELELLIEKQNEKILKNEIKFKSIFDQAALGITYIDCYTGKFSEVNKKFCDLLGYTNEEFKQMNLEDITHPDDIKNSIFFLEKLYKNEIKEYTIEKRYISKSGDIIWVKITVSSLWKAGEIPSNNVVIIEDISKRKNIDEIILKSQQRVESIINTVDGIVWEYDAKAFKYTFISKKVESILGYTSEEWINTKNFWKNHLHPEDRDNAVNYGEEKTAQKINHDFEYRMIAKDGSIVWVRDIVNIIFENGEVKNLRGIIIDITKNKEIENELNNSFTLVSEQNKRLLNFSYIVSHNLRSHTSNISSIVDLINMTDEEEEKEEMIQLLKSVSDSLNDTMLNLNEIVNIQTNIGITIEKLNLKQYIDTAINTLNNQIEQKNINITSLVKNDVEIFYNPAYLQSILYNLLSNAIRYSDEERKPIITIDCYLENKKMVLEVSDNGIGIDLIKNGTKIFGMYKKFSTHKDSKGIGLFITKNQINAMGGSITVESEPNVGTTFKVYLS
ncbi:MAG: PAS domain S-box protein [Flavobacterium sp.]